MKKCTYCGKEYPDEATVCELDEEPLIDPSTPKPSPFRKIFVIDSTPTKAAGIFLIIMGAFCLGAGIFLLAFTHPKGGSAIRGISIGIVSLSLGMGQLQAAKKRKEQKSRDAKQKDDHAA